MKVIVKLDAASLDRTTNEIIREISRAAYRALQAAGSAGRAKAYNEAPVRTGAYRKTIRQDQWGFGGDFFVEVGTDDWKGFILEYGRVDGQGNHYRGKPHFSLAADVSQQVFEKEFNRLTNG